MTMKSADLYKVIPEEFDGTIREDLFDSLGSIPKTIDWQPIEDFPHLQYANSSSPGAFYVRRADNSDSERIVFTETEFASWLSYNSAHKGHLPLGDLVESVAAKLGISRCTPCAKRQARLNRLIRWFG